jgi:hypothetical protein
MLPFEKEVSEEIKLTIQERLDESRELLQLALDMLGHDDRGNFQVPTTPVPGVGHWAWALALGFYSKACKQFRSIIMLGEAGFSSEMTVLTRSLFETALALEFLMRENVELKRRGKEVEIDSSRPLTTDFRAELYAARTALVAETQLKKWSERPELKGNTSILGDPGEIAAQAATARKMVGEAWWKALKKGHAGLHVKDLAESLGVISYYLMLYRDQSEVTHAGDALRHFGVADDGSHGLLALSPSVDGVDVALRVACLIFLGCLTSVHSRLSFGDTVDSTLDAFASRLGVPS